MKLVGKRDSKRLKVGNYVGKCDVAVLKIEPVSFGNHWHDFYEIEIVIGGEGAFSNNGTMNRRSRGDIALLTPVDFHEMKRGNEPVELINIEISTSRLSEFMRKMLYSPDFVKSRRLGEEELQQLLVVVSLLELECEKQGPCVQQLLEYIFSKFLLEKPSKGAQNTSTENMSGIIKAIAYMEQNFTKDITLEKLSQISGYHPSYFSKMFRKMTGEKCIDRLTTLRINYAKVMLKNGNSVSEACRDSGFGSVSNFVAVFKKRCGMTPSAYRDQERNEKRNNKQA